MKPALFGIICFCCVSTCFSQGSLNMSLIYQWTDTSIIQVSPSNNQRFNDVWGYSQNGREYAIIGSTMGIHFFDVTDSMVLQYIDMVPGNAQGAGIVHRDFKNFNNYLYAVCDEGQSSLQVIDMQYLPDSVHLVYDNDSLIIRAHNLFIDTVSQRLYTFSPVSDFVCGVPCGYSAFLFSLADPTTPVPLATVSPPATPFVHDGFIHNDTAIFNCGQSGLYYMYFGNPGMPVQIDQLPFYQDQGYNHSGWLTNDKQHYIMSDETHGMRMKMLDMQIGPNLFSVCDLIGSEVNQYSVAHNQVIRGNFLYVSYYFDGVRVFDISDPCNMSQVGWYDTYSGDAVPDTFKGAWGVYPFLPSGKILVSDMQSGLFVLKHNGVIGIDNYYYNDFNYYPNPSTDIIYLSDIFNNIRIFDVNGRVVLVDQNTQAIQISNLSNGIYLLEVEKDGKRSFKKIMKQ